MFRWSVNVEGYGKIKSAVIQMSPFLAFVGDNNSGKSYLLSLIWGILTIGKRNLYHNADILDTPEWKKCREWLVEAYDAQEERELDIEGHFSLINTVLNQLLERNKNGFIQELFNFEGMSIEKLEIELSREDIPDIRVVWEDDKRWIRADHPFFSNTYSTRRGTQADAAHMFAFIIRFCLSGGEHTPFEGIDYDKELAYLPSARTGFMLTKDIINRVGRNQTFNYISSDRTGKEAMKEEADGEGVSVQPFIRPINHFLDLLADLTVEESKVYTELVQFIEKNMTKGKVDISSLPGKEVRYLPDGFNQDMPLRITSAVVTEISPLLLLLEHNPNLKWLFYEEPEMCLHPQLQVQMARLLIRMVNAGLPVVITTHSDSIFQHINNMIKLNRLGNREEMLEKFGYTEQDLLADQDIAVYQLRDEGQYSEVKPLVNGKYGFVVPTFNDALDHLLDEVYAFQPEEDSTDE